MRLINDVKTELRLSEKREALTRFKIECAKNRAVSSSQENNDHYKGDLTAQKAAKAAPSGEQIVKKMIAFAEQQMK